MDHRPFPKRKRSDIEAAETRDSSFQLENLSNSSYFTLEPVSKLLRAHLPLSWLASATSAHTLPSGSILQGTIENVTAWEYSVLVARQLPNGGLFALEKVDQDVFVAHPLQPFVTDKWVLDASIGAAPSVTMQMMLHYLPSSDLSQPQHSRRTPSLSSEASFKLPKARRGAAARLSILGKPEKQEQSSSSPLLPGLLDDGIAMPIVDTRDENQSTITRQPEPPSEEVKEEDFSSMLQHQENGTIQPDMLSPTYLRQRYLETLYKVKSPLSYYAKGPLSRARARARATDASMTLPDLAAFYRESILPAKKMDLKYKDSFKTVVDQIVQTSAAEVTVPKKTRKTKLGKDGLWPAEKDYVVDWWKARDLTPVAAEQRDSVLKDATTFLRMREAQMQIVLILEVLSIEAKDIKRVPEQVPKQPMSEGADVKVESIEQDAALCEKRDKQIKKRNLETELDVLADKLCIWHSIGLEGDFFSSTTSIGRGDNDDSVDAKDRLRNFCTDVLIPFYSSKLPVLCRSLCKTLAGPELYDQVQKSTRIKKDETQQLPPGAAIKRRPMSRSGTLERVLSEDSLQRASPPALSRSSTLPPVPQFKREPSEASRRPLSRQTSMSFSSREVDLVADAKATASKRRKLDQVATQKQELAAAIQALKKPNRQGVGRAFMEEIESRKLELKQPVLITATPRINRRKTLNDIGGGEVVLQEPAHDMFIPSSSLKPRNATNLIFAPTSSSKKRAVLAALHDTPSRTTSETDPLQLTSRASKSISQQASTSQRSHQVLSTPTKTRSIDTILRTPTKKSSYSSSGKENRKFELSDMAFRTMDRAMNMPVADSANSIYDKLGWNEDDDYGP